MRIITKEMVKFCKEINIEFEPNMSRFGLCFSFETVFDIELKKLIDFKKYPNFSGDATYPIKSFGYLNAKRAFDTIFNIWDKNTEYGKERMRFCKWTSGELQKLLEEQNGID